MWRNEKVHLNLRVPFVLAQTCESAEPLEVTPDLLASEVLGPAGKLEV